jgi:hypothetical protein
MDAPGTICRTSPPSAPELTVRKSAWRIGLELARISGQLRLELSQGKETRMGGPAKYPEEFRREAVELHRSSDRSRVEVAKSLGISDGSLARSGGPGSVETWPDVDWSPVQRALARACRDRPAARPLTTTVVQWRNSRTRRWAGKSSGD